MPQFSPVQSLSIDGSAQRKMIYLQYVSGPIAGVRAEQHCHRPQVGKELLLPELPLTIRLIGLRVTKLKDLRAPSPAAGGIKRVCSICIVQDLM
jgi:hypothetical protein